MRKITLLLCSFTVLGISQNPENQQLVNNFDPNGIPTSLVTISIDQSQIAINSAPYGFEDVRALSEINSGVGDSYPWISADGLRLYYSNGNGSNNNILYSERIDVNSNFSTPTIVQLINPGEIISMWLSADELDAYVCVDPFSNKLLYYHRVTNNSPFGAPTQITLQGVAFTYFTGASLDASQNELYLYMSPKVIRKFDRISATTFTFSSTIPLGEAVIPGPGQLSKNGLDFSLSFETSPTTANLNLFSRIALPEVFDGTTAGIIDGLNDVTYNSHLQPSMSDNNEWIVFVRNNNGIYTDNDLYIARNQNLSVPDAVSGDDYVSVYPNPSQGEVNFKVKSNLNANNFMIEISDATGHKVLAKNFTEIMDLTQLSKGIYFVRISGDKFVEMNKLILN